MATPKFEIPFKPQISPELNYVSPVAKDAKFDSMSGTLALAGKGIELAMEVDKANIVRTAEENATLLSEAYKSQSPSEINYWTQAKNTAELKLAADPEDPYWLKMLNESQNKLVNAKEQGKISAYEFQQRSRQLIDQQLKDNPAYSAEIVETVKSKYSELGILDVIKTDEDLLKASSEATAKERDDKIKYLIKEGSPFGDPFKMNNFDLDLAFKSRLGDVTKHKALVTRVERGDKLNKEEMDKVKTKVLDNPGVLGGALELNTIAVQHKIDEVLDSTENNDIKRRKVAELLRVARLTSAVMIDSIGGDFASVLSVNLKSLDNLQTRTFKVISGESTKEDRQIDLDIAKLTAKLMLRVQGANPELLEYNKQIASIWEIVWKKDSNFEVNKEQFYRVMQNFTTAIFNTGQRIYPDSAEFKNGLSNLFTPEFANRIPKLSMVAAEILKNPDAHGKLDGMTEANFTNVWNVSSQHKNMGMRTRASDSVIEGVIKMDQTVFDYLTRGKYVSLDFIDGYNEELEFSKSVIDREIASLTDGDTLPAIDTITDADGKQIFRSTDNSSRSKSLVRRLNNHIQFIEKMNKIGPKEDTRLLFPRLILPSVSTKEEATSLKEQGKSFVMPSGKIYLGTDWKVDSGR